MEWQSEERWKKGGREGGREGGRRREGGRKGYLILHTIVLIKLRCALIREHTLFKVLTAANLTVGFEEVRNI